MTHFNAIQEKDRVVVVANHRRAFSLGWKGARELCDRMREQLRGTDVAESAVSVGSAEVAFRRQPKLANEREDMILCLLNGALLFDAPVSAAKACWAVLVSAQRAAEEWANAEQIAADAGLLLRTGAPVGLTDHPKIQEESVKVATGDRTLRRALPGGVKSASILGAPRIYNDRRTPADRLEARFRKANPAQRQKILEKLAT